MVFVGKSFWEDENWFLETCNGVLERFFLEIPKGLFGSIFLVVFFCEKVFLRMKSLSFFLVLKDFLAMKRLLRKIKGLFRKTNAFV